MKDQSVTPQGQAPDKTGNFALNYITGITLTCTRKTYPLPEMTNARGENQRLMQAKDWENDTELMVLSPPGMSIIQIITANRFGRSEPKSSEWKTQAQEVSGHWGF